MRNTSSAHHATPRGTTGTNWSRLSGAVSFVPNHDILGSLFTLIIFWNNFHSTLLHSCCLFLDWGVVLTGRRLTGRDLGVMHPRPRMDTADYDAFRADVAAVTFINQGRDSQPRMLNLGIIISCKYFWFTPMNSSLMHFSWRTWRTQRQSMPEESKRMKQTVASSP